MTFEKTLALPKIDTASLARFTALLSVAILAPLVHNQILTGSLVNATLFIAAATLGLGAAVLISFLPSLFALLTGTLPLALAPLLPFIMLSNILLVLSFTAFSKSNFWWRISLAATLKFVFLYLVSSLAVKLLFGGALIGVATIMLSWPQLLTALLGGVLAFVVLKNLSVYDQQSK
ncbi:MAG: iron hydrogenase [Candidatus Falkowbacteria bacterium]